MSNPKLALIPSGYKNSKVYSILPNDGSGDFTFARNSGGTRLNKQGLIEQMQTYGSQLLNNSDFTSTSDWTVNNTGSASSVIENGYLHINTSSDYTEATQSIGLTAGDTYRVDYEILENIAGTISIIGNGGASTIIPSTVGKHTIEYDAQAVFAVKRTTGSTNIKIAYIKLYKVQYNTPRLDWLDSNCPSLLLEPQSTNVLENSEITSTWIYTEFGSGSAGTITTEKTDMFGSTNAVQIDFPADAENVTLNFGQTTSSISSGSASGSVYIKLVESGSKTLQLRCSTSLTTLINVDETKFVRYELSGTKSASEAFSLKLRPSMGTSSGGFSIIVCHPQEEALSFPTSYIPNHGVSGGVTRLADTCTDAGDATIFNDAEGVLYAELKALSDNGTTRRFSVSDGTNNNRVLIGLSSSNRFQFVVSDGGSVVVNQLITVSDITEFNKVAISYKENDCKIYINGSLVGTDTVATMPSGLDTLNFNQGNGTEEFYGKCKDLRYYDTALTDAELTELTT